MRTTETTIQYPLPPEAEQKGPMSIYAKFMQHLRHVPHNREEIKILSAIQFTADMLDYNDALVSKILVDLGLRAPRMAFPAEYLDHADMTLMRNPWDVGGPNETLQALRDFWYACGDDKFAAVKKEHVLVQASMHEHVS